MARRRKMDPERKAFISSLLEHYQPQDTQDIQEMLKDLLGDTLQGMLEAEMDDHLGYSKYDYKNKETDDSRNGYSPKTVTSSMGTIDLDIPRDRKGDFEPKIVKKNQTDISNIEDQVLSCLLYTFHRACLIGISPVSSYKAVRLMPVAYAFQMLNGHDFPDRTGIKDFFQCCEKRRITKYMTDCQCFMVLLCIFPHFNTFCRIR